MERLLLELLTALEKIGRDCPEIYDSEVRQQMSNSIMECFVRNNSLFELPTHFGLFSNDANIRVHAALSNYIINANKLASEERITNFHARLSCFQNSNVQTKDEKLCFDDFMGYSVPEVFDHEGNVQTK